MNSVAAGRTIAIRYILKNSRGEALEDTMEGPPVTYLHGSGTILPALEAKLEGLKPGDARTILISGGQGDDDFTVEVTIDSICDNTGQATVDHQANCGPGCVC